MTDTIAIHTKIQKEEKGRLIKRDELAQASSKRKNIAILHLNEIFNDKNYYKQEVVAAGTRTVKGEGQKSVVQAVLHNGYLQTDVLVFNAK